MLVEDAATAEDRSQRRAQLVRYAADQRVAQDFGLIVDGRLLDRFLGLEVLERQGRFVEQRFDAPRHDFRGLAGAIAQFNGDGAITQDFGSDETHQPGAAAARIAQG